ncbi:molybdate ABC transporter permease subunit [Hydrogenoanaerobacterium sp.]|uniref:molybdate ABC transporter permease subunit n=1 Tax=Hydrogenoanaerobacterium sp. TaxID=2953763 RepID=UPI00289F3CE0|nr:molybdate ABC transporter permease subunit [Hydrogenoanaerobacterium sp.]
MAFDLTPLWISIKTSLLAGVITFVLGVLCARLFLNVSGRVKWLLDVVFTLPLVLPPTVVGFLLLVLCGKNSALGQLLRRFDLAIIFTWQATVISAVVVSFPLMYRAAKGALEQVDENLIWAGRTLGMSEWRIFLRVQVPQAWPGIASGAVLSFARALGEFGATLMIAGNIPGRTQTIPIAIYFATAAGNMRVATIWVAIITLISCIVLGFMNYSGGQKSPSIKTRA